MSHSTHYQFVHIVWSTRKLEPLIIEGSKEKLLAYLTGVVKKIGGRLLASSGTSNHVHFLVNAPTDLAIAELLCQLKSCSSKWYRENYKNNLVFGWNDGYSAFTVSPASIDKVKQYLATEQERHCKSSFEDELMSFLHIQEIKFNSKYLSNTTYTRLLYHLVWSVKNREPLLNASLQEPLHQSMQLVVQKDGGKLYAIGNVADHIHLLVEYTTRMSTVNLVQNLKTTTTHLIKSLDKKLAGFSWQEGYGVFSVGKPAQKIVTNYVMNQESHHRSKTFEQEWDWLTEKNILVY